MAFVTRRLGDVVTLQLADEAHTDALADSLRAAGVEVDVRMVDGETADRWRREAIALDAANAVELRDERRLWRKQWGEADEEGRPAEPQIASGAMPRFRRWSLGILRDALMGLRGWHDDLDTVTDGAELGREVDAYDPSLAVMLARACQREQMPSSRQGKS